MWEPRLNFLSWPMLKAWRKYPTCQHAAVFLGRQHDYEMPCIFFKHRNCPSLLTTFRQVWAPTENKRGIPAAMDPVINAFRWDRATVSGDTNTTLADAVAAH